MYRKVISTGDFSEALEACGRRSGPKRRRLRLKTIWRREYEAWSKRDLSGSGVYIWADGIYSNVRLDDERPCFRCDLRRPQATACTGFAKALSWQELILEDLKRQGLELAEVGGGTERWGVGRHCGKSIRRPVSNALSTDVPTCSISCRRACRAKAKQALRESILRRVGRGGGLWTVSPIREEVCKAVSACRPPSAAGYSTTFRPSTGGTCGRRTRSSPPLRRSVCGSDERRVVAAAKRRSLHAGPQAERHWRRLNGEVTVHVLRERFSRMD